MYTGIYIDRTPYFKNGTKMVCHIWDDEMGHVQFPITPVAYERNVNGTYISMYGEKLSKVTNFVPNDPTLIESDVPLETRLLIDMYGKTDDISTNNRIVYLDIEVDSTNGFPDVETANKTITAISLYDSVSKHYFALILDKNNQLQNKEIDNTLIRVYSDEYSLLVDFKNIFSQINPTIVTGWNSEKFDMPYLYNRMNKICTPAVTKQLSSINIVNRNKYTGNVTIAGVNHIDYMNLYKKFTFKVEPSYALNAIGLKVVKIGKVKFSGSIDDLYKNDINKFIEYNLNDVKIIVAIDEKLKYIEQAISLCHNCHVPYTAFQKSSIFLEGAILTYMRREGIVSKNKPLENLDSEENFDEEGFEGAFVKEPIPGKYVWVYDEDLQSLYPSLMMTLNISPETKRETAIGWNPEEYMKGTLKSVTINGVVYSIDNFVKYLRDMNYSVASNGVMYSLDKVGIIPKILDQWFKERVEYRKLEKKYGKEGNTELYNFYHHKQLIRKVLLNSIYGVLGLPSFRFYDKDNASAVTMTGQTVIKTTARIVNKYYATQLNETEEKDRIIYIDTDSVASDSIINTDLYGNIKVSELFDTLKSKDENVSYIRDVSNREFVLLNKNYDVKSLYYDSTNKANKCKYGNIQYIEKHRVKKRWFRIKSKSGKIIECTEDHSIEVLRNGVIVEVTPTQLQKNDKIITIKT